MATPTAPAPAEAVTRPAPAPPPRVVPGTQPYPWPWDGALDPRRLAVVVAGWDDGWSARAAGVDGVSQQIAALATAVGTTYVIAHPGPGVVGSAPAGHGPVALPGATAVTAAGVDGFYGSPLDRMLRAAGRDQLLVCGLGLEGPVHSTLRSANDRGYECLLVLDASAPLDTDLVTASRSMVLMSGGIFGAVGATADVLAALTGCPDPAPDEPVTPTPGGAR